MSRSSPHPLTTVLHIAGVAALAWIAVELADLPRSGESPPAGLPAEQAVAVDSLLARIESLERELARARAAPAGASPAAGTGGAARTPVDATGSLGDVVAAIEALRQDLRHLGTGSRLGPTTSGRLGAHPTNWAAVQQWRNRLEPESEGSKQELLLMAHHEILQRFGKPSHIHVGQGGETYWTFTQTQGDEASGIQLVLREGLVIDVYRH